MPARSIRWRPACSPSRWARRPRPCLIAMDGDKTYRFTARWGEARDTDDAEGKRHRHLGRPPVARGRSRPRCRVSSARSCRCRPPIPPSRSQGERAYDLAREGETAALSRAPISSTTPGWWTARCRTMPMFEVRLRQRLLYPRLGPRPGAGAGHGRPCLATAPDASRAISTRKPQFRWKRWRVLAIVPPLWST